MLNYKPIDRNPRFLALDQARRWLPETFEHAVDCLLDHEIDLTLFKKKRCSNDDSGAPAYPIT